MSLCSLTMKASIFLTLSLMLAAAPCMANSAPTEVRVGGYQFAPFVEISPEGEASGLTLELIEALNLVQNRYHFVFVPTKPAQRYKEFEANRFDMLLFENKTWGWNNYAINSSSPYLSGGERYIAQALPGRGQDYFDNLQDKRLVGIRGYHYRFANFNADPNYLHEQFTINLIDSNAGSIRMVLSGRVDVAVVTQSYLFQQLASQPELQSQLLISEKFDQRYQHCALIRAGTRPAPSELDNFIKRLQAQGTLDALWQKYGLMKKPEASLQNAAQEPDRDG
ncbi:transporter substrate-binding domain-containing protein [Simiduia sp. 21SJ11W-1]|uniref:substrate-binding periplasmic protein n=1 Tax=Simiduia sp. 21SJ11W-1 TaxID=2909669 RepID=UPI0020A188E0|nr:transporter substrate-binding domain-containing protein [Simiduia sp. 21SJ11W-1]UTA48420.1 transporter substrate-binding domain-containing protein [Simiduia sp. 21SJ11W-1]